VIHVHPQYPGTSVTCKAELQFGYYSADTRSENVVYVVYQT